MKPLSLAGILVAALLVYIAFGTAAPAVFFVCIASLWWIAAANSKPLASAVQAQREVDRDLVTPKEWISVRTRLRASGARGLRWFRVSDAVTDEAEVAGTSGQLRVGQLRHQVELNYRLSFPKRGSYEVGPARLQYGDLFGLAKLQTEADERTLVDVHPPILPVNASSILSNVPYGDVLAHRRDYEDVNRPVGMREYVPGDPLNRIHWPGTARTGTLMLREFDASSQPILVLTADRRLGAFANEEAAEWAMTVLASLFASLPQQALVGMVLESELRPSDSLGQREAGLRMIARSQATEESLGSRLVKPTLTLPWRSTLVAVVSRLQPEDQVAFEILRKKGHRIALVFTQWSGSHEAAASCDSFA
ncbi:MAG: DUF58 domain-containing protein, partial [bacterium]